jgi:hypothetical protein
MNQLLHVSAGNAKETEDGVVETVTLGAVSIDPSELIQLVGEQVVLTTPGQKGRSFHGNLTALLVKDGKHGPEVTLKVAGARELHTLVGTNVTVEAAQIRLPVGPGDTYGESSIKQAVDRAVVKAFDEVAKPILEGDCKPDDLENF